MSYLYCLAFTVLISTSIVLAQDAGSVGVDDFSWLEGTWKRELRKGKAVYEVWKREADTLRGSAYRLSYHDSTRLEELMIVEEEDGLYYKPLASGQNNNQFVPFKFVRRDDNEFTFENPLHDFPQRIVYARIGSGTLYVRVEGDVGGKLKKSEWIFHRVISTNH